MLPNGPAREAAKTAQSRHVIGYLVVLFGLICVLAYGIFW